MPRPKVIYKYVCDWCGGNFERQGNNRRRNGSHTFCNSECATKWRAVAYKGRKLPYVPHGIGDKASNWKGGGITSQGYKSFTINHVYYLEHRYIMEQHLGRKLNSSEHVHHINGNKLDNRIENLELIKNAQEHSIKYHSKFYGNQYTT